jgi:predicted DCC family thiol-disulfide oxidoreductase YuxK
MRFAPQQSAVADELLGKFGVSVPAGIALNSVYLVVGDKLLTQSDVTVALLLMAGGVWGWLGRLLRLVPLRLRNWAYRLGARNRFRVSARYEVCPLPPASLRAKFLA